MGTSVLHIKTEVECRVYLFDEEKGIAKPGTYFNLEVRKGEQDLLFVSTEDEAEISFMTYNVEEGDCDYRMTLGQSQFIDVNSKPTDEDLANGIEDEYGVVYSRDGMQLLKCRNHDLKNYQVPEGCRVIRRGAFLWKSLLTSITLPADLAFVGEEAFWGCESLTAITLPAGLTHIGNSAFANTGIRNAVSLAPNFTFRGGCLIDKQRHKLLAFLSDKDQVTLPDGLTHIGDYAFYNFRNAYYKCWSLTAITLPDSLTHIGDGAFLRTGIRKVVSHSPNFTFQNGCLIDQQNHKMIAFLSDQDDVTLPADLTHIGNRAFEDCNNLTTITLPAGLTHIGDVAFGGCSSLTAITLPYSLTHIGDSAFWGCSSLTAITLPTGLTHIGDGAFGGMGFCNVVSNSPNFIFQDGCLIDNQHNKLIAFLSYQDQIVLPAGLTHIGDSAFWGCRSLTTITMPSGLTHIGDNAFSECKRLSTITLPATLTDIGYGAFSGCTSLTTINLPDNLMHIGDSAFSWCKSLIDIILPICMTHIGDSVFSRCGRLKSIALPTGLTHIGICAFLECESLTTITLPAGLTHIGDSAFNGCISLTAITLPTTLTHIGAGAFDKCLRLTHIYIPTGMRAHFEALLPDWLHHKMRELS